MMMSVQPIKYTRLSQLFPRFARISGGYKLFLFRKTKTKVIILANHQRHGQYSEPINTGSKHVDLTRRAGKRVRARQDWLWFF